MLVVQFDQVFCWLETQAFYVVFLSIREYFYTQGSYNQLGQSEALYRLGENGFYVNH
jgi:hypothetical protein